MSIYGVYAKDIRNTSVDQLKQKLSENYAVLRYDPSKAIASLCLNNFTKKYIKHILARITDYLERETGVQGNYYDYMNVQTKNPFEIEHILTDHYSIFSSEYTDEEEFQRWRNNIGALLLLRKSINASLNDSLYHEKIQKYCSNEGNIYTEALGAIAYKNHDQIFIPHTAVHCHLLRCTNPCGTKPVYQFRGRKQPICHAQKQFVGHRNHRAETQTIYIRSRSGRFDRYVGQRPLLFRYRPFRRIPLPHH